MIRAIKEGMSGEDVRLWKAFLKESTGFYRGGVDDVFDAELTQALKDFQRFHELPGEGVLTDRTLGMALLTGLKLVTEAT